MKTEILSLRVSRRAIGAAILQSDGLVLSDGRHIPSAQTRATAAAIRYVERLMRTTLSTVIIDAPARIARQLVSLIPDHTTYVEPFAGGAQVFFHKPRSKVEVLNDLDDEIINFLRICQRHPQELSRVLRWQPASRRLFDWHQQQPSGS